MDALSAACRAVFDTPPRRHRALHGGYVSEVVRVTLEDGRDVVAKRGPLVAREARMLEATRASGAPAPAVLGLSGDILFLEALNEAPIRAAHWPGFGRDLARLHGHHGADYGWPEQYAFGPLELDNRPAPDWPSFWAERRLRPLLPGLPASVARRTEALADRLHDHLPAGPAPALLHGDLWMGNVLGTAQGAFLIDPACYHGDAEVDLAMLHLFGTPGHGFAESYGPLEPGWQARRPVYTLFPALVHLRLFGDSYRPMVEGCLSDAGV